MRVRSQVKKWCSDLVSLGTIDGRLLKTRQRKVTLQGLIRTGLLSASIDLRLLTHLGHGLSTKARASEIAEKHAIVQHD